MAEKKKKRSPAGEIVDLNEVERLLDFMDAHGLEEFEYARGDMRIRLKKPAAHTPFRHLIAPDIVIASPSPNPGPATALAAAPARESAGEAARSEDLHVIKSPIVGTFYEAPSPGAEAFVRVGDSVESGQVVCIIEAMKLMNEIESDAAGEVMRILVENGQPVEYGEPLFAIHPNRKK